MDRGQGRFTRWHRWQGAALACAMAGGLAAQEAAPAFGPASLDCARYRQAIHSTILLESGGTRDRETIGRDGILVLRADTAAGEIALVAWFDTLDVWREGSGERLAPGTDGVIGGRFRGRLSPDGRFASTDRPFVPDEIAQVTDVGDALERLLPRLPPRRLQRGESWKGDSGAVITRLGDAVVSGGTVERYRLSGRFEQDEVRYLPDSTAVTAHRSEFETGTYDWTAHLGVLRWERTVTIEVSVPKGGVVKQAFRTRIEQKLTTTRLEAACDAR